VTSGTNVNTLKTKEGDYILNGYPGPGFPPIVSPADPNDQVAVMSGNDTAMVVGNFGNIYQVGARLLLAVYNGTVMEIPDFSITPPAAFVLPGTTTTPVNGPSFTVSRNSAFNSTVTLHLHGDADAAAAGHPEYDILPNPPVSPPLAGDMNQPTWSTDVFIPAANGTRVDTSAIQTTLVPTGIYTVWLEGHSGNPYFQTRRVLVPVRIGGAVRDFGLQNSTTSGAAAAMGDSITLPIYVSTTTNSTKWNSANPVSLSYDAASFTDCSLNAQTIGAGQITLSAASVVPSATGSGGLSNLTISSVGPQCRLLPIQHPRHRHQRRRPAGDPYPADHLHRRHQREQRQLRRHHRFRCLQGQRGRSELDQRHRGDRRVCGSRRPGAASRAATAPGALVSPQRRELPRGTRVFGQEQQAIKALHRGRADHRADRGRHRVRDAAGHGAHRRAKG